MRVAQAVKVQCVHDKMEVVKKKLEERIVNRKLDKILGLHGLLSF